jgi:HSP20 family protein
MLSRYNVSSPLFPVWGAPSLHGSAIGEMMNRLFDDLEVARGAVRSRAFGPGRVQLRDQGDSVFVTVDLPGCRPEDIELEIEGTTLSLSAAAAAPSVPEGFKLIHRERQPVALQWSVELPYPVEIEAVSATFQQGCLQITLPKAAAAKPRTIAVKTA